jgi:chromosome segregation ATPase
MTETQLAAAVARADYAEAHAMELRQSQVFAEEALRATQVQRNSLAEQLADAQRRLQAAASPAKASAVPAVVPPSEADWLSEAGYSDASSAFGGDVDALSAQRVRKQREEARARAAANKARFEAIKAERNALRMHARTAAADLDAMRQEAARVAELKEQLLALQKTFFV